MKEVIDRLLKSEESSVRYKVRVGVLGEDTDGRSVRALRREITGSERVRSLLAERNADGVIPRSPYHKWMGSHWVLTVLADLGYP
ncbi:unnamed protein product, partial [marine sediment metagenome]